MSEDNEDWNPTIESLEQTVNLGKLADRVASGGPARGLDHYVINNLGIPADRWAEATDRPIELVERHAKQDIPLGGGHNTIFGPFGALLTPRYDDFEDGDESEDSKTE